MLAAAGPGRVCFRVDIQLELITLGPVSRISFELSAIGHNNGDFMIVRMYIFFHT